MKTLTKMFLPMAMMLTGTILRAQDVSLGDVTFTAASAETDATWYDPMNQAGPIILEGFGTLAGKTRTITYSPGGVISGVATIKRKSVEKSISETTEEIWLAFDSSNDVRVLKIVRNGNLAFEARAADTPPLYIPSLPKDGQTWDLGGATVTVDSVIASNSGTCLKITHKMGEQAESRFLRVGDGIIYIEAGSDSGWRPRALETTP